MIWDLLISKKKRFYFILHYLIPIILRFKNLISHFGKSISQFNYLLDHSIFQKHMILVFNIILELAKKKILQK